MTAPTPACVPLKTVALPNEHGGWGFTLELVLLGLLVSPSAAGLGLGLAALAAFFLRHPLKLWLADLRKGKHFPRTALARRFALLYAGLGVLGLGLAVAYASQSFWPPLALAIPFAAVQLWFDVRNKGRNLLPELCGALAMGSVAAGIALAGGLEPGLAFGLWLVLAMRALAAIYYARSQVMRARGREVSRRPAYRAMGLAIGVLALAALLKLVSWVSLLALGLLLPFAAWSFSRPPVPAKVVGWTQMGFGLLIVLVTALGTRLGL